MDFLKIGEPQKSKLLPSRPTMVSRQLTAIVTLLTMSNLSSVGNALQNSRDYGQITENESLS